MMNNTDSNALKVTVTADDYARLSDIVCTVPKRPGGYGEVSATLPSGRTGTVMVRAAEPDAPFGDGKAGVNYAGMGTVTTEDALAYAGLIRIAAALVVD